MQSKVRKTHRTFYVVNVEYLHFGGIEIRKGLAKKMLLNRALSQWMEITKMHLGTSQVFQFVFHSNLSTNWIILIQFQHMKWLYSFIIIYVTFITLCACILMPRCQSGKCLDINYNEFGLQMAVILTPKSHTHVIVDRGMAYYLGYIFIW